MKAAISFALLLITGGCAQIEVLSDGTRVVTGLVRITIPPQIPSEQQSADAVEVKAIGLSVLSTPTGSGITLGYAHDRVTAMRNHASGFMQSKSNTQGNSP